MQTEAIIIDRKEFRKLMNRISTIEQYVKDASKANTFRKWISEEEAMSITGLAKRTLREKRAKGIFTYSSATGRKIKYLRTEIEDYLNDNSTR